MNLLALQLDLPMNILYIVFGCVIGALLLTLIVLAVLQLATAKKLRALKAQHPKTPTHVVIESEDLTIRVKDAALDAYDTPAEPEPAPAAEEEPEEEEPIDGVLVPRAEKLSFAEKYERLPEERRRLLDEFSAYLCAKPDCEQLRQSGALRFRYQKGQIAKAVIRRDSVYLNFAIVNPDLGRMIREERSGGLKMKPVEVRLDSEDALAVAKQTADLTVLYLQQEQEYKTEKRKEARREAARQRREEAAQALSHEE